MPATNSLPGPTDHFISLQTAIDLTTSFRTNRETILATGYQNKNVLSFSETFNKAAFEALLAEPECAGIRVYYGMDESDQVHAVFVAVNEDNEDLLPGSSQQSQEDPVIIEAGQRCPPSCPPTSALNS